MSNKASLPSSAGNFVLAKLQQSAQDRIFDDSTAVVTTQKRRYPDTVHTTLLSSTSSSRWLPNSAPHRRCSAKARSTDMVLPSGLLPGTRRRLFHG